MVANEIDTVRMDGKNIDWGMAKQHCVTKPNRDVACQRIGVRSLSAPLFARLILQLPRPPRQAFRYPLDLQSH